jgi:hypothetical protein
MCGGVHLLSSPARLPCCNLFPHTCIVPPPPTPTMPLVCVLYTDEQNITKMILMTFDPEFWSSAQ